MPKTNLNEMSAEFLRLPSGNPEELDAVVAFHRFLEGGDGASHEKPVRNDEDGFPVFGVQCLDV